MNSRISVKHNGLGLFTIAGLTRDKLELALLAAGVPPSDLWNVIEEAENSNTRYATQPPGIDRYSAYANVIQGALAVFPDLNEALPAIDNYIINGKQIQAIKALRSVETLSLGLKEAKDWCDERREQLISSGAMQRPRF